MLATLHFELNPCNTTRMGYIKDVRRVFKLVRTTQTNYEVAMKFIDRIKARIKLVVAVIIIWAVAVLGLAIYIAIKVS